MKTIPSVHCFNHNYVLPAGVAFYSLLQHACTPNARYAIHVIGTGLTDDDMSLLGDIVARFPQATLEFHDPPRLDLPVRRNLGNFSADIFYKMAIPEILPQYDGVIVSDVDVVYADDVASFANELRADEDCYLCGTPDIGFSAWRGSGILRDAGAPKSFRRYERLFTEEERKELVIGVGLFAMDGRLCRADGMTRRWLDFAKANFKRLILPEQDVLNICCHPRIKVVSSRFMAIAGYEPEYRTLSESQRAANPAWDEMFAHPVQIHYASAIKPWKFPHCACSRLWFEACLAAGLFDRWREWYARFMARHMRTMFGKRLLDVRLPFGRRIFHVQCHKESRT